MKRNEELVLRAMKFYGIAEYAGDAYHPEIEKWAKQLKVLDIFTNDEVHWCGLFIGKLFYDMKLKMPKIFYNHASWRKVGKTVKEPQIGDIVITPGHVSIFVGFNNDRSIIHLLGGNQSAAVKVSNFKYRPEETQFQRINRVKKFRSVKNMFIEEKKSSKATRAVTADFLNIREEGNGKARKVSQALPKGTRVRVKRELNGWAEVKVIGKPINGWVSTKHIV